MDQTSVLFEIIPKKIIKLKGENAEIKSTNK